jgi:hypothetical protein
MTKLVPPPKSFVAASSSFRQLGKLFWGQWPKLFPGRLHGRRTAGHSRSHPPFQRESNIFSVSGKEHALGPGGSKDNSPSLSSFLAREWCSPVLPQKIQDLQVHVAAKVLECGTMMKFSVGEFYKQAKTNQASIVLLRANNSNSSHRIPCSVAAGLFLLLDSIRWQ